MNIFEFDSLDDIKKAEILLNKGALLADRDFKNFIVLLYQVNNFYVEVYIHNTYKVIQFFRSFNGDEALEPYINDIDLSVLKSI